MTKKMGSNDARRVVWATSKYFLFLSCFINITIIFRYCQHFNGWSGRGDAENGLREHGDAENGPKRRETRRLGPR